MSMDLQGFNPADAEVQKRRRMADAAVFVADLISGINPDDSEQVVALTRTASKIAMGCSIDPEFAEKAKTALALVDPYIEQSGARPQEGQAPAPELAPETHARLQAVDPEVYGYFKAVVLTSIEAPSF